MLPSAVAALEVKLEPKKHSNRNTDSDDPAPPRLCPRSPPISPHLPPSGDVLRRPTISPDYPLPTHRAPLPHSTHYASGLMLRWHNEQNIHVTFFRPPVFTGPSSVRFPPPLFHARTFSPCPFLYTSFSQRVFTPLLPLVRVSPTSFPPWFPLFHRGHELTGFNAPVRRSPLPHFELGSDQVGVFAAPPSGH